MSEEVTTECGINGKKDNLKRLIDGVELVQIISPTEYPHLLAFCSDSEVANFVPTSGELVTLLKYWTKVAVESQYGFCVYDYWSRDTIDVYYEKLARYRIIYISKHLGDDEVKRAVDEAIDEVATKKAPIIWDIFWNGNGKQREALHTALNPEE